MPERTLIGMMSGTSADGVDACLVRIIGSGLQMRAKYLRHVERPYSNALRRQIIDTRSRPEVALPQFAQLGRDIAMEYAAAAKDVLAGWDEPVDAIAAHGQTLFHAPPLTVQWIDPALLAQETGIDVIADFRRADCAVGGQGAPLVPFADYVLFRSDTENRVLLNIGGIANVTILRAGASIDDVIGFDTGPGNCISDHLLRERSGFDEGGELASRGRVDDQLLRNTLSHPYFAKPAPKSTDGPEMIAAFCRAVGTRQIPVEDQLATAAEIVVEAIAHSIQTQCHPERTREGSSRRVSEQILREYAQDDRVETNLIVAGGGVKNGAIMDRLKRRFTSVRTTDEVGDDLVIPAQAREAMAFAVLGAAFLDRVPANLPRVTGSRRRVVLGALFPSSR